MFEDAYLQDVIVQLQKLKDQADKSVAQISDEQFLATLDPEANNGRPKEIKQDGWTIDYLAYADAPAAGVKRVNLVRNEPPLDIKLVLDQ